MIRFKDNLIKLFAFASIFIVMTAIFLIFSFVFLNGISGINIKFLTENPKGMPLGVDGGIRNAIIGSFLLMVLSMFFSTVLGICFAIYNKIFCKSKIIKMLLSFLIQCISSIPSIIIGLFVYGFFIVTLNIPKSLFTASIALSLMVFPFVELNVEKLIEEFDRQSIRDSYALGIDKIYMCRKLILPTISNKIVSISILAGSYAAGATAPLLLTGVVFMAKPSGLFNPVMALPFHLHMLLSQSVATEKAYATAMVLIGLLIILNLLSEIIMRNIGGKIVEYIRNKKS
ncbi:PstA family ABC transporter permease [Parvimonas micra]|uniref:PstA family ABC transporter permease n=1 Tax=Parvimonas micra TaxID=33033 RepID=UPI002003A6CD|nr:ABC transporter permease subunit [Parvimonas micra]MCK6130491.1 ABC transporter permease subunit [Parvimonas micra]MCK6136138.1 ABC transporter permease subunit [Parvimonas micra]MCK6137609.1 ABC transporter permease subunit [Parvimonas micra]MCK6154137.1 ABC transporter permease subunit [Parvimonas micra]